MALILILAIDFASLTNFKNMEILKLLEVLTCGPPPVISEDPHPFLRVASLSIGP
jgi:hypothetical protein